MQCMLCQCNILPIFHHIQVDCYICMYIVQNIQAHKIIGHNTKCVTRDKVKISLHIKKLAISLFVNVIGEVSLVSSRKLVPSPMPSLEVLVVIATINSDRPVLDVSLTPSHQKLCSHRARP